MVYLGATNFKKDFIKYFTRFSKIYIHNEKDDSGEKFVETIAKYMPDKELYSISASDVDISCKDPCDLHQKGKLDLQTLLATAKKVSELDDDDLPNPINAEFLGSCEEHVFLAEKVMKQLHIKYYNQNFYVYDNGVYKKNLPLIESTMLSINKNAKKHLRTEVLEYIRIHNTVQELEINEQYINFKNGLYDLNNNKLIEHNPNTFNTCQINANYYEDSKYPIVNYVRNFIDDIMCNNQKRVSALLEIIGYCMTFKVNLQQSFFFYRSNC